MDVLIAIMVGAISSLIAAEVYANGSVISQQLIDRALLRLPEHERSRYREEWIADNSDFPGTFRKLAHAAGCLIAAPALARNLRATRQTRQGHSRKSEIRVTFRKNGKYYHSTMEDLEANLLRKLQGENSSRIVKEILEKRDVTPLFTSEYELSFGQSILHRKLRNILNHTSSRLSESEMIEFLLTLDHLLDID